MLMQDRIRLPAQTNHHRSVCCSLDDTGDKERLKPDFHQNVQHFHRNLIPGPIQHHEDSNQHQMG
jgi:hypothetical protein